MAERISALREEHEKLGAEFGEWNGMQVPTSYAATTIEQDHDAIRDAAGLYDLTAFRKIWIKGPDAREVVNKAVSRDVSNLNPGRAVYAAVLTDDGGVTDDGIVYCFSDSKFLWIIGSGTSGDRFAETAKGKDVQLEWDNEMQVLSFQGPKAVDVLAPNVEGTDLRELKFFGHTDAKLFGRSVHIARAGYSGERGYEIYASPTDAPYLWQQILEAGKSHGVIPASFNSLNPLRVEAGLLFYPFDVGPEKTPWEVSAGFLVDKNKPTDFLGKEAVLAKEGKERFILRGIATEANAAIWEGGEEVTKDGKKVGEVNVGNYSHRMGKALAYVFVDPDITDGTKVQVGDKEVIVENLPFYDKKKERLRGL